MKRLLALTAALTLVGLATTAVTAVPAMAQQAAFVRGLPQQVTRTTTPARDRFRPYTFTTRGRVVPPANYCLPGQTPLGPAGNCIPILCPPGVTDISYCFVPGTAVVCSGYVNVRVQKRGTTISSRNVQVRPDCSYRSSVTFRTLLRTRIGILSFRARFQGNLVLRPRSSSTGVARAG